MTRSTLITALLYAAVFALIPGVFSAFTSVQLQSPARVGDWIPVVHVVHNAYFLWKPEFLARLLSGFAPNLPVRIELFLMALGFYLLASRFTPGGKLGSAIAPAIAALAVPSVIGVWFGADAAIIPPMAVFPWVILAAGSCRFLLMLAAGILLADSARQLALLYASAALVVTSVLPGEEGKTRPGSAALPLWICLFVPALVQLWRIPVLPFPDYPILSRVVPDDGIRGIVRPLLGPDTEIPSIDRTLLKESLWPLVAGLFCLWSLLIPAARLRPSRMALMVTLLLISVLIDVLPSENFAVIGPVAALSRMLPGLFLAPLSPVLLAISFAAAIVLCAREQRLWRILCLIPMMLAVQLLISPTHSLGVFDETDFAPYRAVAARGDFARGSEVLRTLLSPSYAVAKKAGAVMLYDRAGYEALHFKTPPGAQARAWPDGNDAAVPLMFDRNPETRWSTKRGDQRGDEWIEIYFEAPRRIKGIEVSSGKYLTDFARGIRVSYLSRCENTGNEGPQKPLSGWKPAADDPGWQGEIKYTPDGYPYYGSQSVFRQYFPEPIEVQCLLIEQTGTFGSFEWSVAEVRIGA